MQIVIVIILLAVFFPGILLAGGAIGVYMVPMIIGGGILGCIMIYIDKKNKQKEFKEDVEEYKTRILYNKQKAFGFNLENISDIELKNKIQNMSSSSNAEIVAKGIVLKEELDKRYKSGINIKSDLENKVEDLKHKILIEQYKYFGFDLTTAQNFELEDEARALSHFKIENYLGKTLPVIGNIEKIAKRKIIIEELERRRNEGIDIK